MAANALDSALSGLRVAQRQLSVISTNIANVQTPGFKQILTTAQDFMQNQSVYANGKLQADPEEYVGTLGLGTQIGE